MIRIIRAPAAMSVQDWGRPGHAHRGYCRSGAMDRLSMDLTNRAAGAATGSAVIEMGPTPCVLEATSSGTIAFGGATRSGAPWWEPLDVSAGDVFELSSPRDGLWSYLGVSGGVMGPEFLGSRSTCVREGVGAWIKAGDQLTCGASGSESSKVEPPEMSGTIRVFGQLPLLRVGTRLDRMGYEMVGGLEGGKAEELSEPTFPGFVQVLPSGNAFVLMAEAPTLGGYPVIATIHPDDLRLLAQARPGQRVHVTQIPAD